MGFNSKRFISTRYFSSALFSPSSSALFFPPSHTRKCVEEIKAGVDEKKKTQGMRRDSAHSYGVFIILGGVFFRRAKIGRLG